MRLHHGIFATAPSEHPIRTLNPMRLLAAAAHLNEKACVPLTHKLFGAYWVHNKGKVLMRKHVLESLCSYIKTQFYPGYITCCAELENNRNLTIR